eukprot:scaffold186608_cov32-Tisochrysis_lutea.AAC.1
MACSSQVPAPFSRWMDWTDPCPPGRMNRSVRQPSKCSRTSTSQLGLTLDGCENITLPVVDQRCADRQSAGSLNLYPFDPSAARLISMIGRAPSQSTAQHSRCEWSCSEVSASPAAIWMLESAIPLATMHAGTPSASDSESRSTARERGNGLSYSGYTRSVSGAPSAGSGRWRTSAEAESRASVGAAHSRTAAAAAVCVPRKSASCARSSSVHAAAAVEPSVRAGSSIRSTAESPTAVPLHQARA